ncbi:MAG TPA: hypothetical protein VM163_11515 [bacterium]|nr:hypothetical protein [bacterium]
MQAWVNSNFLWTQFAVCGVAIFIAGTRLSRFGDIIGKKLKIGSTWVGLVLLAAITSMPEMITSCTAGGIGAPDMAAGNLFGSNLFNLAILGILGLVMPRRAVWAGKGTRHLLSGSLNGLMMLVALLVILLYKLASCETLLNELMRLPVGVGSILLLFLYFLCMFLIFLDERHKSAASAESQSYKEENLPNICVKFGVASAIIVLAGWRMVMLGHTLAQVPIHLFGAQLVLGQSIVGTLFLAVATSLPELTVCYAAVKIGSVDMAIGNVFGSNIFNIATFFLADLFFTKGPILAYVSEVHVLTGLLVVVMSVLFITASTYSRMFRGFRQVPLSAAIVVLWLIGWLFILAFTGAPD